MKKGETKKLINYTVGIMVPLWLSVDVKAASLEEALQKSNALTLDKLIKPEKNVDIQDYKLVTDSLSDLDIYSKFFGD